MHFPNYLFLKTQFETKGESKSLAIAAASIISRYAFVKHMNQITQQIKMEVPKGASNKVDLFAAKIIQKSGLSQLDAISKKHFKNRDKALALIEKNILNIQRPILIKNFILRIGLFS